MGAHTTNRAGLPVMAIAILAMALAAGLPAAAHHFGHHSDSKGEHVPEGKFVWFNAILRVSGVPKDQPLTLCVTNQVINWSEGTRLQTIHVSDAIVAFKPWETYAHTFYGLGHWDTSAPNAQAARDTFMSGMVVPRASAPSGKARNVTWAARFSTSTPGVTVHWAWGKASYKKFSDDNNALGLAVADIVTGTGRHRTVDEAGTPVAFKADVADDDDDDGYASGYGYGYRHDDDDDCGDDDDDPDYVGDRSDTIVAPADVTTTCAGGGGIS